MKTMIIDISPSGEVTIEAKGFTGNSCAKATEQIEIMLGGEAKKTKKPEFYAPMSTQQGTKLVF